MDYYKYEWPQGNTHDLLTIQMVRKDGTTFDLTAVPPTSINLRMRPMTGAYAGMWYALTGSAQSVLTPASNGEFTFQFSAADVATVGRFELEVVINYGATQTVSFPQKFEIISA